MIPPRVALQREPVADEESNLHLKQVAGLPLTHSSVPVVAATAGEFRRSKWTSTLPIGSPCSRTVTPEDFGKIPPTLGERAIEQPDTTATRRIEIDAVPGQQRDHLGEPIHVGMEIKGEWVAIVVARLRQRRILLQQRGRPFESAEMIVESGAAGLRPHPADRTRIRRTRLRTRDTAPPPWATK